MEPRVIFSYGLTKSGSTFAFELIRTALEMQGFDQSPLSAEALPLQRRINFAAHLSADNVRALRDEVWALGHPVVIKTHARPDPAVIDLINAGDAAIIATHRDPRDMALSMLDHGTRSRGEGKSAFAELETLAQARDNIASQFDSFTQWLYRPNCLPVYFGDLTARTPQALRHMLGHIGFEEADVMKVIRKTLSSRFIQLNKGQQKRFRSEMSRADQRPFLEAFHPYHELMVRQRHLLPLGKNQVLPEGTLLFAADSLRKVA
ncbi:MAG: sulfotransferase domain-containing protein [Pseudomonadota bacterium]